MNHESEFTAGGPLDVPTPETAPAIVIVKERRGKAWWTRFSVVCATVTMFLAVSIAFTGLNSANNRADDAAKVLADNRIETNCRAQYQINLETVKAQLNLYQTDYSVALNRLLIAATVGPKSDTIIAEILKDLEKAVEDEMVGAHDVLNALAARAKSVAVCAADNPSFINDPPTTVPAILTTQP